MWGCLKRFPMVGTFGRGDILYIQFLNIRKRNQRDDRGDERPNGGDVEGDILRRVLPPYWG